MCWLNQKLGWIIEILLFLQLMGVVVLGFGIFALTDGKDVAKLVDWGSVAAGSDLKVALYTTASTVLVVVAILAIIVAFLGCCGAVKVLFNHCMLYIICSLQT